MLCQSCKFSQVIAVTSFNLSRVEVDEEVEFLGDVTRREVGVSVRYDEISILATEANMKKQTYNQALVVRCGFHLASFSPLGQLNSGDLRCANYNEKG